MNAMLLNGGRLVGVLGVLLMLVGIIARLAGHYTLGGLATVTLLLAGIAAVSVACFLMLWVLVGRSGPA